MGTESEELYVAFAGSRLVASGQLPEVAMAAKALIDQGEGAMVLVFHAVTSQPVDVDFRGTPEEVAHRLEVGAAQETDGAQEANATPCAEQSPAPPVTRRPPGRPKLGVVAREVTLFPRHWQWLSEQPGGASVTLRKLVEEAKRSTAGEVQLRQAREACYRFMNAMAGNEPGFEEATRALFAGNQEQFRHQTQSWPVDVRDHARHLVESAISD